MKNRNLPHSDHWATPKYFMDWLKNEIPVLKVINYFDPCPLRHDLDKWNGLLIEWGTVNFINPPYSIELKTAFIKKAIEESKKGKLCIMLLPVSTSTKLFHDIILPNIDEPIRFIKGRIKFEGYDSKGNFVTNKSPMHDSMIVIF